jgi:hypothetical protein
MWVGRSSCRPDSHGGRIGLRFSLSPAVHRWLVVRSIRRDFSSRGTTAPGTSTLVARLKRVDFPSVEIPLAQDNTVLICKAGSDQTASQLEQSRVKLSPTPEPLSR